MHGDHDLCFAEDVAPALRAARSLDDYIHDYIHDHIHDHIHDPSRRGFA
jgi:hypothetical protein